MVPAEDAVTADDQTASAAPTPLSMLLAPRLAVSRVHETARRFDHSVAPMAVLSALFLLLDTAVLAEVLDRVADGPAGRGGDVGSLLVLLSATGGTLAVWALAWPLALRRASTTGRPLIALVLGLGALACAAASVLGERWLVATCAGRASDQALAAAARLEVVLPAVRNGSAVIAGLDIPERGLGTDDGRTLMAILPAAAMASGSVSLETEGGTRAVFRGIVEHETGGAADAYDNGFIPSVRALREAYNRYVDLQEALAASVKAMPGQIAAAWSDYAARLAAEREDPAHLPRSAWAANADTVRADGIDVPPGWRPGDRAAFAAAAARGVRQDLDAGFARQIASAFGVALPPGLSWEDFVSSPGVQARWRRSIDAPDTVVLAPDMGFDAFAGTVYGPAVERRVDRRYGPLLGPATDYAPTGRDAGLGRDALAAVVLPPAALFVGLLLFVVNAGLLAASGLRIAALPRPGVTAAGLALLLAAAPAEMPDPVSRSPAFAALEIGLFAHQGAAAPVLARWMVQAVPLLASVARVLEAPFRIR